MHTTLSWMTFFILHQWFCGSLFAIYTSLYARVYVRDRDDNCDG